MRTGPRCPFCRHAMRSHYAGMDPQPDGTTTGEYRCHWVEGVPGGRCPCARRSRGWDAYGEPER